MSKSENVFFIYFHYTLDANELFYIGKGKKNRHKDLSGRNVYWNNIVKKHGFRSEIYLNNLDEETAFVQEIELIKKFKPKANLTKGGVGGFTGINSGMFKKGIVPWNKGKKLPHLKGLTSGSKNGMFGKKSPRRQKIICENDQRVFDCHTDAAKFYSINRNAISNVLYGKNDTVRGLVFRFYNDFDKNIKALKKRLLRKYKARFKNKKILCVNNGIVYPSINQCAKTLKLQSANIIKVLKAKRNHTGGFTFRYL
jgi:hypothetical protein